MPNKATALLKDAILRAAEEAGGPEGLVGYLQQQAIDNPGPFMALLGKVLPLQLTGENGGPIQTEEVSARELLIGRVAELAARSGETNSNSKPH